MFHKSKKTPSQGRYGGGRASESYGGRGGSSSREGAEGRERFVRKKVCRFCTERIYSVDYKETEKLQKFLTEKGKILPQRISGNCTKHQRILARAIKRARHASMVPFQMT